MAAAPKAKAARTASRAEPEERIPENRAEPRMDERDPNVIRTRDGRVVDLKRVQSQNNDRLDLAAMGVIPPAGWVYEWRTVSVKNQPWLQAVADDAEAGWTPVPAERHDGKLMPRGHKGPIEYNGLQLMERDERLTRIARAHSQKEANRALSEARSMAGMAGQVARAAPNSGAITDFNVGEAQKASFVRSERTPRQNDAQYTYTLDE